MTPIEEVRTLLEAAQEETQYRTVASRAYFAAYAASITIAQRQGFSPNRSADDHGRLIDFLKLSTNPLLRRIGYHRLPRLRSLRNGADYDRANLFTEGLAKEAAQTAEEVVGWIDSLMPGGPDTTAG